MQDHETQYKLLNQSSLFSVNKLSITSKMSEKDIISLSKTLTENASITHLSLGRRSMDSQGFTYFFDQLQKKTQLSSLRINLCLSLIDAQYLGELLRCNKSLVQLKLNVNRLTDDVIAVISQGLYKNTTLTELNLGINHIGNNGAEQLAELIKANNTLRRIGLERNRIEDTGLSHLSNALKKNSSLTHLNIRGNQFTPAGIGELKDALKYNYTLVSLSGIEDEEIQHLLQRNKILAPIQKIHHQFKANASLDGMIINEQCIILNNFIHSTHLPLDQLTHLEENLRLLNLLGHISQLHSPLSTTYVLQQLLQPFGNAKLQKIADIALGRTLCLYPLPPLAKSLVAEQKSLYLLAFYCLQQEMDNLENQQLAYLALAKFLNPQGVYTLSAKEILEKNTVLLSYKHILAIVHQALANEKQQKHPNLLELHLLETIGAMINYHPQLLSALMNSPAFWSQFKNVYPAKTNFAIAEHFLFHSATEPCLINVPQAVPKLTPGISNELHLCFQQSKAPTIKDRVELIKKRLKPAFSDVIVEEALRGQMGFFESKAKLHKSQFRESLQNKLVVNM